MAGSDKKGVTAAKQSRRRSFLGQTPRSSTIEQDRQDDAMLVGRIAVDADPVRGVHGTTGRGLGERRASKQTKG